MFGPYTHNIDPIIASVLNVHLWWYGLSYTLGFLNAFMSIRRRRNQLGLSLRAVYDLAICLAAGVLFGGRFVEVVFYEWAFYREHVYLIPAYWLGGMATHGLLFGGLIGIWVFCWSHRKPFLTITDALSIPAAFILGVGRIGNFIDGQIVGSVTTAWWAVKFPDAEGFRHPVVLYDGLKNLFIIPILLSLGKRPWPSGVLTGVFLFLYASLRIFVDVFREYPTTLLGLATGQSLNLFMTLLGLVLVFGRMRSPSEVAPAGAFSGAISHGALSRGLPSRRAVFVFLLLFSLVLPSDWTQDVPARYGRRHPGLEHSILYPNIDTAPVRLRRAGQAGESL